MGIDLPNRGRTKSTARKELKSPNPYLKLLTQLYEFLARRTHSKFNAVIAKRLIKARRFKTVISLRKLIERMKGKEDQMCVVVGSVTNDLRVYEVPKLTVCALRFSELARQRLVEAGGECITFDQLAMRNPKGTNTVLLRGPLKAREADKHFGKAPGVPHSNTKAYVRAKGRKFEKARGKRASRGYQK